MAGDVLLVGDEVVVRSEAAVKVMTCSVVGDDMTTSSGAGVEDNKRWAVLKNC
jgi:hypothetical protein